MQESLTRKERNSLMKSITEGMRHRKRIVTYAIRHNNNAQAARKYHTTRQYVSYWRKRYDGTLESLRKQSRRPHIHPNQHAESELELIRHMYRHHSYRGLAHVYRKCCDKGYTRSYDSMCRQIRKMQLDKPKKKACRKKKESKKIREAEYPGQLVQMDIKYIPVECIGFASYHSRYYQITAIDVFSRKRVLSIVNENSTYTTSCFLETLEDKIGFKIEHLQTDNGKEFCNDPEQTDKKSRFEKMMKKLEIKHIRTAPYRPWENGHVERSHREDEERFYRKRRFVSEEEMIKAVKRHESISNGTYRNVLDFKSSEEVIQEYFENAS